MTRRHPLTALLLAALAACAAAAEPPRLVVQIVVDGLPTETALLHADRFRPGGMGRFFRDGAVYTGAELPYLTTFTAVGHASLFTGTVPAFHGIIGNEWINSGTGAEVYCVEDPSHSLLDFPSKPREGMSPANLESPTVGDELVRATGGAARVFSVSGKDRGAILPGGRLGKAFWYAKQAGTFATSTYYYPETPAWLREWRGAHHAGNHQGAVWGLLRPAEDYLRRDADDRPTEKGLGPVFPHALGGLEGDALAEAVRWTPLLDEMTIALAEDILRREGLGRGAAPDMLCISLSALDFVSHQYGPDSLEAEDTLYRADALLEAFFAAVDGAVGMDKTLVVLTADHGFTRAPEEAAADGMPAVRLAREDTARLLGELRAELAHRFSLPPEAVRGFLTPFVYFDRAAVAAAGAPLGDVQRAAAETVLQWPGVAWTAGREDLLAGRAPRTKFHDRAAVSLSPARGGDVLVALKPGCLIETAETGYPATHGSPHAADTRVPVLFLGAGVAPARVHRPVSPLDIAATVAAALGVTPPPCCVGEPLPEIVPSTPPKP